MPATAVPRSRLLALLIREPLLHFLLLGLAIFAAAEWYAAKDAARQRTINIDAGLQSYLENLHHAQFGVYPDAATLKGLIDTYVREEVLFREAMRAGLAEQDEIIRRRLVQKLEYLLQDAAVQAAADPAVLQAYYQEHLADYTRPARISFRHIYFGGDPADLSGIKSRAEALLADSATRELQAADGAPLALPDHFAGLDAQSVAQVFGQSEFSRQLFDLPLQTWSGPLQSGYGWHLVYVEERSVALAIPYELVADVVFAAWQEADRIQHYEQALQDLIDSYTVTVAGRDAARSAE